MQLKAADTFQHN